MKIPRGLRMYVVVTQYVLFAAFLTFIGYYLGHKLDVHVGNLNFYSFVFGLLGIMIGLAMFVYNIAKMKHGK